jgi:hypothetical protein
MLPVTEEEILEETFLLGLNSGKGFYKPGISLSVVVNPV